MQSSVVFISELKSGADARIDPEYYQPFHLHDEDHLLRIQSQRLGSLADIFDGPFGSVLHADRYVEDGVPVLRMQNVTETGFLTLDEPEYISTEDADALPKHLAYPKDIIVTKIGFIGYATVLPRDFERYFFRREVTRVKIRNTRVLNPYFLATFFNSAIGRRQTNRFVSGATRDRILLTNQRKLLIPTLASDFQLRIEVLCKAAYKSIGTSKNLYHQAEHLLLYELGLQDWQPQHQLTFVRHSSEASQAHRVDAEHFQPKYNNLLDHIRSYTNGFCSITDIAYNSTETVEPRNYPEQPIEYIELANINQVTGVIESTNVILGKEAPSRARMFLRSGDVIASSVKGSVDKVARVPDAYHGAIGSTGFFVLRPRTVESGYLLALVKSVIVREQMECEASGTILAAVPGKSLHNVIVPDIPGPKRNEIAILVEQSHAVRREAQALLEKAKHAVEIAIEQGEEQAMAFLG